MKVLDSISVKLSQKWDDPYLMNILQLHLDYVNNRYNFNVVSTLPITALKYQGNLYGLFTELNIPASQHKFMAYINGYNNPNDFNGEQYVFKVVPESLLSSVSSLV